MEEKSLLIDKYLNNELKGLELIEFEQSLETDPLLAKEVQLQSKMYTFLANKPNKQKQIAQIKSLSRDFFQKEVENQQDNLKKIEPTYKKKWFLLSSAAAVLLLVVSIFYFSDNNNIYDKYANHKFISFVVKGDNTNFLSQEAVTAFNSKDYKAALPLLKQLLLKQEDPKIKLALGICLLETNKTEDAITFFSDLGSENIAFKNEANWYLALSYLKQKDNQQTKFYLNRIVDENSYYFKDAQKLIKELDL